MEKKILIIDDDLLVLYGLQKALRQEGVEVITASSGSLAMDELSICPYDLCLLDIHLPDHNGLELMKIIKQICPKTRVIVMTASYTGDDDLSANIKQAAANGACHFLTKPFELDEVKGIIKRALSEEDFHTGVRFANNTFIKKNRKFRRMPCGEQMELSMTTIGEGRIKRRHAEAEAVDISKGGMGVLTCYPLRVSQVVYLKNTLTDKTGIVVWSTMDEGRLCRAGVRFA